MLAEAYTQPAPPYHSIPDCAENPAARCRPSTPVPAHLTGDAPPQPPDTTAPVDQTLRPSEHPGSHDRRPHRNARSLCADHHAPDNTDQARNSKKAHNQDHSARTEIAE